jgi:hypothetical protein
MPFLTNFAPAAAGYDDAALGGSHRYIMVAATAGDGHIFYNWQNLGESWQGWTEIPGDQRTDTSPAVSFSPVGDVAFQVDMWAAIKGMDGLIYINNAANNDQQQLGTAFGSWFPLAGLETRLAPAGAVVSNGIWPIGSYTPVTAAVAEDGTVNLNTDGQWLLLPGVGRTDAAVAAALVGDNYLFIVAKGLGSVSP